MLLVVVAFASSRTYAMFVLLKMFFFLLYRFYRNTGSTETPLLWLHSILSCQALDLRLPTETLTVIFHLYCLTYVVVWFSLRINIFSYRRHLLSGLETVSGNSQPLRYISLNIFQIANYCSTDNYLPTHTKPNANNIERFLLNMN